MDKVTYYARFSYEEHDEGENGEAISVCFPDVRIGAGCGDSRDEAIKVAAGLLETMLDMGEDDIDVIYPPSSPEDLEAEADSEEWSHLKGIEIRREFVPITIVPPSDVYLRKQKPHPRTVTF